MPNPNKTETDLAAEHRRAKNDRAVRWDNRRKVWAYYTPSPSTVEPEFDEFSVDEAERIARGLLHRRGQ